MRRYPLASTSGTIIFLISLRRILVLSSTFSFTKKRDVLSSQKVQLTHATSNVFFEDEHVDAAARPGQAMVFLKWNSLSIC